MPSGTEQKSFFCVRQLPLGTAHHLPNPVDFLQRGDHWKHHADAAAERLRVGGCSENGSQLDCEELGMLEGQADTAPPHEGIGFLVVMPQVGHRLITADVERADRDLMIGCRRHDIPICRQLLLFIRYVGVRQVQVFGAKQADS